MEYHYVHVTSIKRHLMPIFARLKVDKSDVVPKNKNAAIVTTDVKIDGGRQLLDSS